MAMLMVQGGRRVQVHHASGGDGARQTQDLIMRLDINPRPAQAVDMLLLPLGM